MSELIAHIKELNAEAKAWEAKAPGRAVGLLLEDEKWWNETRDVYTVEDFKRWEIEATLSDLAKEAYGTRRACPDTTGMSLAELEEVQDRLIAAAEATFREEQRERAVAVKEFEATVMGLIDTGASDRETAIRWLRSAGNDQDEMFDDNYFEYCNNLPYGYLKGEVRPEMV